MLTMPVISATIVTVVTPMTRTTPVQVLQDVAFPLYHRQKMRLVR